MSTPNNNNILREYAATANNPEYKGNWEVIDSKFPELKDYDKQVLREYAATANNPEYKGNWNVIDSKFPELFGSNNKPLTDMDKLRLGSFPAAPMNLNLQDKPEGQFLPPVQPVQPQIYNPKQRTEDMATLYNKEVENASAPDISKEFIQAGESVNKGQGAQAEATAQSTNYLNNPQAQAEAQYDLITASPTKYGVKNTDKVGNVSWDLMADNEEYMNSLFDQLPEQKQYEEWQKNPERWNDRPFIQQVKTVQDNQTGFWASGFGNAIEALNAGGAGVGGGLSEFIHQNIEKPLFGWVTKNPNDRLAFGRLADIFFEDQEYSSSAAGKHNTVDEDGQIRRKDFVDYFKEGDYTGAFGDLGIGALESAPTSAVAVGATIVGAPQVGLGLIGAQVAGTRKRELDQNNPELSELQKTMIAYGSGAIEAGSELLGDIPIGKMLGKIYKVGGTAVAENVMKNSVEAIIQNTTKQLKNGSILWKAPLSEGAEEFASGVGNYLLDSAMGIQNFNFSEMMNQSAKQMAYGAVAGGGFGLVGAPGLIRNAKVASKLQALKSEYDAANSNMQTAFADSEFEFDGERILTLPIEQQKQILASALQAENLTPEQKTAIQQYMQVGNSLNAALVNVGLTNIELLRKKANAVKQIENQTNEKTGKVDKITIQGTADSENYTLKSGIIAIDEKGKVNPQESDEAIYYFTGAINEDGTPEVNIITPENISAIQSADPKQLLQQSFINIEAEEFIRSKFGEGMQVQLNTEIGKVPGTVTAVTPTGLVVNAQGQEMEIPFVQAAQDVEPIEDNGQQPSAPAQDFTAIPTEELSAQYESITGALESGALNDAQSAEASTLATQIQAELSARAEQPINTEAAPVTIEPEQGATPVTAPLSTEVEQEAPAVQPQYPVLKDGTPDFDNMSDEQLFNYNLEQFGEEAAVKDLTDEIAALQKQIAAKEKSMSKAGMKERVKMRLEAKSMFDRLNVLNSLIPVKQETENNEIAAVEQQPIIAEQESASVISPRQKEMQADTDGTGVVGETTTAGATSSQAELDTQELDAYIAEQSHNNKPTQKQKETGKYDKARINLQGYNITLETLKGEQRSGTDSNGKDWAITMNNHYGELDGTTGYDGDAIDVFVGPNPKQGQIFVIDQVSTDGSFDESKVMLGFDTAEEARAAYLSNYEADWQGFGNITPAGDKFKTWLYDGKKQRKPFAEYKETPDAVEVSDQSVEVNEMIEKPAEATKTTQKWNKNNPPIEVWRNEFEAAVSENDIQSVNDIRSSVKIAKNSLQENHPAQQELLELLNTIKNSDILKNYEELKAKRSAAQSEFLKNKGITQQQFEKLSKDEKMVLREEINKLYPELSETTVQETNEQAEKPEEGKNIQFQAIENTAKRIDEQYFKAIERGDMEEAQRIVDQQAANNGYISKDEYKLSHRAPSSDTTPSEEKMDVGGDFSLVEIANGYSSQPEDYFDVKNGARWYGYDYYSGRQSQSAINSAIRAIKAGENPTVTIYRAVEKSLKENEIRNGDWITLSSQYAKEHGQQHIDGPYKIISQEVPAEHIWWDGNDINEWGYDDGKSYAYKNTKNNRKLTDVIVRDDNGEIIPPSKRFNQRLSDPRFHTGTTMQPTIPEEVAATVEQLLKTGLAKEVRMVTPEEIAGILEGNEQLQIGSSKSFIPNVRGGWTKEKIVKYLKSKSSDTKSNYGIVEAIADYDSFEDFKNHVYYHGTTNSPEKGLKPSITMSERQAEMNGGGGYGERYYGVSLTKSKRVAEHFSGTKSFVDIYPVLLKKDAIIENREDLEDANEVEDIIVDLYNKGVDAVWIGGGEQELVVINPYAAILYKNGRESFKVFGGFKSIEPTEEELKNTYEKAKTEYPELKKQYTSLSTKDERNNFLYKLDSVQFLRTPTGTIYGFVKGGIVYLNSSTLNLNTPIHEFGHLWVDAIEGSDLYNRGAELVQETPYWERVNTDPNYKDLSETARTKEAMAMAIGDKGEAVKRNIGLFARIRTWINDVWKRIGAQFGIQNLTPEQIQNLTFNDFVDVAVSELMSGEKLDNSENSIFAEKNTMNEQLPKQETKLPATIDIDGIQRSTTNSTGKPIHSTEEGIRNFWKWFGNSTSIDKKGRPIVFYHGSFNYGFDKFNESKNGIYFSNKESVARGYSYKAGGAWLSRNDNPQVYSVYLKTENPVTIDALGKKYNNIPVPGKQWKPVVFGKLPEGAITVQQFATEQLQKGYDSVIVENTVDSMYHDDYTKSNIIVVKNSTQIKSATGNDGSFDPNEPDIRYQIIGERGAEALDAAEEATTRLDNLAVAKEMEGGKRNALRVDENGRNIVWENDDYMISVNDPENATYIVLWNNGKKVGELFTTKGRNSATNGYLSVQNVEIDKQHRGKGLSSKMYDALLNHLGKKYKGISSENEQRVNKKQVPQIWKRLNATEIDGNYTVDKKQFTPQEIRLATGWERGVDGLWRYEVPDIEIKKDVLKELEKNQYLANQNVNIDLVTYRKHNNKYDISLRKKEATSTNDFVKYNNLSVNELKSVIDNQSVIDKILNGEGGESFMGENWDEAKEFKTEFTTFITGGELLERVVENKQLFNAYPELKNVIVVFDKSKGLNASYEERGNQKIIRIGAVWNETKSTLIHEIQHAIQEIEGFAKGGSQLTGRSQAMKYYSKRLDELDDKQISGKSLTQSEIDEYESINEKYQKALKGQYDFDYYKLLAGETEARNASARMNMSEEERRNTLLTETVDVAPEDQIVLLENMGVSMSEPTKPEYTGDLGKYATEIAAYNESIKNIIEQKKQLRKQNNEGTLSSKEMKSQQTELSKIQFDLEVKKKRIKAGSAVPSDYAEMPQYTPGMSLVEYAKQVDEYNNKKAQPTTQPEPVAPLAPKTHAEKLLAKQNRAKEYAQRKLEVQAHESNTPIDLSLTALNTPENIAHNLSVAKQQTASGADKATVLQNTGWLQQENGIWKFEKYNMNEQELPLYERNFYEGMDRYIQQTGSEGNLTSNLEKYINYINSQAREKATEVEKERLSTLLPKDEGTYDSDKETYALAQAMGSIDELNEMERVEREEIQKLATGQNDIMELARQLTARRKQTDNKLQTKIQSVSEQVSDYIRTAVGRDIVDVMTEREFKSLIAKLNSATSAGSMRNAMKAVNQAIQQIIVRKNRTILKGFVDGKILNTFYLYELDAAVRTNNQITPEYANLIDNDLMNTLSNLNSYNRYFEIQGKNKQGVSIARNVDEGTRQIMQFVRDYKDLSREQLTTLEGELTEERNNLNAKNTDKQTDEVKNNIRRKLLANERKQIAIEQLKRLADIKDIEADIKVLKTTDFQDEAFKGPQTKWEIILERQKELEAEQMKSIRSFASLLDTGRSLLTQWKEADQKHADEIAAEAIATVTNKNVKTQGQEKTNPTIKKKSLLKTWWEAPLTSFEFMLSNIDQNHPTGEGPMYRRWMTAITKATDKFYNRYNKFRSDIQAASKEIMGMDLKAFTKDTRKDSGMAITYKLYDEEITGEAPATETIQMTKGELLYVWLTWQHIDGREKLEAMSITEGDIKKIAETLGDKYIEFAKWTQNYLNETRETYNETHVKIFGTSMGKIKNYFPLKYPEQQLTEKGTVDEINQDLPSTMTGAIVNRVRTKKHIKLDENFLDTLMEHAEKMESWNAFAGLRKDLNTLIKNANFRNQMNANSAGSFEDFKNAAKIAVDANQPSPTNAEQAFMRMVRRLQGAAIAGRINTAIKQSTAGAAYIFYNANPKYYAYLIKNLKDAVMVKQSINWAKENLPTYAERVGLGNFGNEKILLDKWENSLQAAGKDRRTGAVGRWIDNFAQEATRIGMLPNKWVDGYIFAVGSHAIYEYEKQRYLKAGMEETAAEQRALFDAANYSNKVSQSSNPAYLAPIQKSKTMWAQGFTAFMNASFAFGRNVHEGAVQLTRAAKQVQALTKENETAGMSPEAAKKLAQQQVLNANGKAVLKLVYSGLIANVIFQLFDTALSTLMGGGDDDDDMLKKKILNAAWRAPLNNTLGGSQIISVIEGFEPQGLLDGEISKAIRDLKKIVKEGFSVEIATTSAQYAMKMGLGLNIETVLNIYNGIEKGIIEEGGAVMAYQYITNVPKTVRQATAETIREGESLGDYAQRVTLAYDRELKPAEISKLVAKKIFTDDGNMTRFNRAMELAKEWQKLQKEQKELPEKTERYKELEQMDKNYALTDFYAETASITKWYKDELKLSETFDEKLIQTDRTYIDKLIQNVEAVSEK